MGRSLINYNILIARRGTRGTRGTEHIRGCSVTRISLVMVTPLQHMMWIILLQLT